jgi:hypothetical protein
VLFCSTPTGNNKEGLIDDRHAWFFDLDTWRDYVTSAASHGCLCRGSPGGL